MEYSKKEKMDAVRGYIKELMALTDRISNTDNIMKITTLKERSELFAKLFRANEEMYEILDRLEDK